MLVNCKQYSPQSRVLPGHVRLFVHELHAVLQHLKRPRSGPSYAAIERELEHAATAARPPPAPSVSYWPVIDHLQNRKQLVRLCGTPGCAVQLLRTLPCCCMQ